MELLNSRHTCLLQNSRPRRLGRDLRGLAVLAISALHLPRPGSFLARLVFDDAFDLLDRALDLVLEAGLSLVVGVWSALLGHACARGSLGRCGLGLLRGRGGLALARGFGGWSVEDSGLCVAGCAAGLCHC